MQSTLKLKNDGKRSGARSPEESLTSKADSELSLLRHRRFMNPERTDKGWRKITLHRILTKDMVREIR